MMPVQSYEHDIFISYAHIDDMPLMSGEDGWVSEFHRSLNALVNQILGEELKVWRDPKLQGNDYFDETLIEAVPRAAVLVSVLSPRYLKSEWCLRELECFAGNDERIENKSRIFKVVKTLVEREQEPPPLDRLLGYEFFSVDEASGKPAEFRIEFGTEAKQRYLTKLYDLSYEIAETLKQVRSSDPQTQDSSDKEIIYLAETSSDLREQRERVKGELRQLGYTVLPDKPLPIQSDLLRASIQADLERCSLSIHMIGANHSFKPEGDQRSIVRIQNDIAAGCCRRQPLQRLIWMSPDLTPNNDQQRKLVEYMQTDSATMYGADVLVTNLEELKTVAQDRLRNQKKMPATVTEDLEHLEIYLVCDQCDFDAAMPLFDYLYDQGHEVVLPVFEGSDAEIREDHTEKLLSCDAVLIYHGKTNDLWLSSKLRDIKKLPGFEGYKPKRATAIFAGAPATPQKERLRSHDALILKNFDAFAPLTLEPLMAALSQSTAGTPV